MNIVNTILVIIMWFGIWECLNTLVEIGFANKVCGTALVKRNPDQFLILSEQKMNEPFEFKGTKYNSLNEFAKTKPGLWKNLRGSCHAVIGE